MRRFVLILFCWSPLVLAACGSSASHATTGTVKPKARSTRTDSYRFVGAPQVLLSHGTPDPAHNLEFVVLVRLDRVLPRDVRGSRSIIKLGSSLAEPLPIDSKAHCYSALVGDQIGARSPLRAASNGTPVAVTIQRQHIDLAITTATVHEVAGIDDSYSGPYLRKLGCRPISATR